MHSRILPFKLIVALIVLAASGFAPEPAHAKKMTIRVLSYNVNDLPWPLRKKTKKQLKIIGNDLGRRKSEGTAPDIVLLQEAFTDRSKKLLKNANYPYVIKGPGRRKSEGNLTQVQGGAKIEMKAANRGTNSKAYVGSGLYILSKYPIIERKFELFGERCSGNDCFANKAILLGRIQLPGFKTPLDIITSHMDANKKSEASAKARLRAFKKQARIVKSFIDTFNGPRSAIFAGDLNIKDVARYNFFTSTIAATNAGQFCLQSPARCKTGANVTPDSLWRQTNDQHFIIEGADFRIVPVFMERNYDQLYKGKHLSDHLGFEVIYEVSERR